MVALRALPSAACGARWAPVALAAAVALAALLAPAAAARQPIVAGAPLPPPPPERKPAGPPGVRMTATIAPNPHFVGDHVMAEVDVVIDPSLNEPASVRVTARFKPYERLALPSRRLERAGNRVRVTHRFLIACYSEPCVDEERLRLRLRLPPARVALFTRAEKPVSLAVQWPRPTVVSRLPDGEKLRQEIKAPGVPPRYYEVYAPIRVPPEQPAFSFRLPPALLGSLLLSGSFVALLAAAGLAYRARPERSVQAWLEQGPPPTPLEEALALVAETSADGGGPEQREALERLARELREAGLVELTRHARRLAWSADEPSRAAVDELTADVLRAVNGG